MILVCGEALVDVFVGDPAAADATMLPAEIEPWNISLTVGMRKARPSEARRRQRASRSWLRDSLGDRKDSLRRA